MENHLHAFLEHFIAPLPHVITAVMFAFFPVLVWLYIFWMKNKVSRTRVFVTFFAGVCSVIPLLLYKMSWEIFPAWNIMSYTQGLSFNLLFFIPFVVLPFGAVVLYAFVAIWEEYLKHVVVHHVDRGFFRNIDDAIEYSIIAALGFSFIENTLYFYYTLESQVGTMVYVTFIFRAVFSTFAHILFSGIYGYFYGIAYFANPIWAEERRKKRHPLIKFFHKVTGLKTYQIYALEKVNEGLLLAVLVHTMFNVLLEMNLSWFMVPFLLLGYLFLDYLFQKKENHKKYGDIYGEYSSDFEHFHQKMWVLFSPETIRRYFAKRKSRKH